MALQTFSAWFGNHRANPPKSRLPRRKIHSELESLEGRCVPSVSYHGGPLLANVEVESLFYGTAWQTNPSLASQIDGFLGSITNSTYMDQLKEYSEPGYVIGRRSLTDGRIGPVSLSSGQTITDASIQQSLNGYITSPNGGLKAPDPNRLYFVFTPPNVHVQTSNGENSISNFLGYHSSFIDSKGARVNYAVVVDQAGNAATVRLQRVPAIYQGGVARTG